DALSAMVELARTNANGWFAARRRAVPFGSETFVVAVSERGIGYVPARITRDRSDLEVRVPLRPSVHLDLTVRAPDDTVVAGAQVRAAPRFLPIGNSSFDRVDLGARPEVLALFETTTDAAGRAS